MLFFQSFLWYFTMLLNAHTYRKCVITYFVFMVIFTVSLFWLSTNLQSLKRKLCMSLIIPWGSIPGNTITQLMNAFTFIHIVLLGICIPMQHISVLNKNLPTPLLSKGERERRGKERERQKKEKKEMEKGNNILLLCPGQFPHVRLAAELLSSTFSDYTTTHPGFCLWITHIWPK